MLYISYSFHRNRSRGLYFFEVNFSASNGEAYNYLRTLHCLVPYNELRSLIQGQSIILRNYAVDNVINSSVYSYDTENESPLFVKK